MARVVFLLFAVFSSGRAWPAAALQPVPSAPGVAEFLIDTWDVDDGLPHTINVLYSVLPGFRL